MIRLLACCVLALLSTAPASAQDLDRSVSRRWWQHPTRSILLELERRGNVVVWVVPGTPVPAKTTLTVSGQTVKQAIDALASKHGWTWQRDGRLVVVLAKGSSDPFGKDTKKRQGRTLLAWRKTLLLGPARERGIAAQVLATAGKHGVETLVGAVSRGNLGQAALGGLKWVGAKAGKPLLKVLKEDPRNKYRYQLALQALGPSVGPLLLEALKSKERHVALISFGALVMLKPLPKGFVQGVRGLLKRFENDRRTKWEIVGSLSRARPPEQVLPLWLDLLKASHVHTRKVGVNGLSTLAERQRYFLRTGERKVDRDLCQTILKAMSGALRNDPAWQVRFNAVRVLKLLRPITPAATNPLGARLKVEPNERVGGEIIVALAEAGPEGIPFLLKAVQSKTGYSRTVAHVIRQMGPKALPKLVEAAKDPAAAVRALVASALGRLAWEVKPALPILSVLLKDRDPRVRIAALQSVLGLREIGYGLVGEALANQDPKVRAKAVDAAMRNRKLAIKVVPQLAKVLSDPSPRIRQLAADALGRAGQAAKPASAALLALLKARERDVRAAAARAFRTIQGDPAKVVPALCGLLEDPDPIVQSEATRALCAYGTRAKVGLKLLLATLERARTDVTRRLACQALTAIGTEAKRGLKQLLAASRDPSELVRSAACLALASVAPGDKRTAARLFDLLADGNPRVRSAAISGFVRLPRIGEEHAATLLLRASQMLESSSTLGDACRLLARLGRAKPEATRLLLEAMDNSTGYRLQVVRALGSIGAPALPQLLGVLKKNPRSGLVDAVGYMKLGKASLPSLLKLLRSEHTPWRRVAAKALARMGKEAAGAVEIMVVTLRITDYTTRQSLVQALRNCGEAAALALGKELLDPRCDQPGEIGRLLRRLGPKGKAAIPFLVKGIAARNYRHAQDCARILGGIGASAVDPLVKLLRSSNDEQVLHRVEYALYLAGPAAAKASRALLDRLAKSRYYSSGWAARALVKIGAAAVPTLTSGLYHRDARRRQYAVRVLTSIGKPARPAIPALLAAMRHAPLRYLIPQAIRKIGIGKRGMARLEDMIRRSAPGSGAALAAASAVTSVPLAVFERAVKSRDRSLRLAGLRGLKTSKTLDGALIEALVACLRDGNESKRLAKPILVRQGARAVPALQRVLDHRTWMVRLSAIELLGAIGKSAKPAAPKLLALFKSDPQQSVRIAAAQALGQIGVHKAEVTPVLLREWSSGTESWQHGICAAALASFGPEALAPLLEDIKKELGHTEGIMRKRALVSLVRVTAVVPAPDAKTLVLKLMRIAETDPEWRLQALAMQTLGAFGVRARVALPLLHRLLRVGRVSGTARRAIGRIRTGR